MIHIKNLKKLYSTKNRTVAAINDINLQFPDKGMVFIVGKSGSGKSTLLNILAGITTYRGDLINEHKKFTS